MMPMEYKMILPSPCMWSSLGMRVFLQLQLSEGAAVIVPDDLSNNAAPLGTRYDISRDPSKEVHGSSCPKLDGSSGFGQEM
jgi:hypothetical protein